MAKVVRRKDVRKDPKVGRKVIVDNCVGVVGFIEAVKPDGTAMIELAEVVQARLDEEGRWAMLNSTRRPSMVRQMTTPRELEQQLLRDVNH